MKGGNKEIKDFFADVKQRPDEPLDYCSDLPETLMFTITQISKGAYMKHQNNNKSAKAEISASKNDVSKIDILAEIPLTMDGTCHVEITQMGNLNYPEEILLNAKNTVNIDRLEKLHEQGKEDECKQEAANQVKELSRDLERLTAHFERDVTDILMHIGDIGNYIEKTYKKKAYKKFRNKYLKSIHRRNLEHARQLAANRKIVEALRSIGKNRILEVIRLLSATGKSVEELLKHPAPKDTTEDKGGELFTKYVDAKINLYRLGKAGINFVTYSDARRIAGFESKSLTVLNVTTLKKVLNKKSPDVEEQKKYFKKMLTDGKLMTTIREEKSGSKPTPTKDIVGVVFDIVNAFPPENLSDEKWLKEQKKKVQEKDFLDAYERFVNLAKALNYQLPVQK